MSMQQQLMLTIGIIGAVTMVGVFATFYRKGQGFGPLNLRAMGPF
jgi:hypothetical protein